MRECQKSVSHCDLHTGYLASFCSASNDCNEKSGFDHYNQWPTSKVFIFTFLIVFGLVFNHDSGKIWARWCGWQKSWDGDKTDQRQGGLDH